MLLIRTQVPSPWLTLSTKKLVKRVWALTTWAAATASSTPLILVKCIISPVYYKRDRKRERMTVRWNTWSTSERKIFKVNVKGARECVAEMTECQEVSKLKECMNRKGMFEGEVVGVCWGVLLFTGEFFKISFKVSKVRCVTALARGPTKQQG